MRFTFTSTGLLVSPNVVVSGIASSAVFLGWKGPPTLDITDVDLDISSYTVYITNTNTGNTGTVSVAELDGNGVVETEYTFTGLPGEDPDPCHVYQFSVSAWNVVGEGERSEPVEGWFLGGEVLKLDRDEREYVWRGTYHLLLIYLYVQCLRVFLWLLWEVRSAMDHKARGKLYCKFW